MPGGRLGQQDQNLTAAQQGDGPVQVCGPHPSEPHLENGMAFVS